MAETYIDTLAVLFKMNAEPFRQGAAQVKVEWRNLKSTVSETATATAKTMEQAGNSARKFASSFADSTKQVAKQVAAANNEIRAFGKQATLSLTLPIAGMQAAAIHGFASFDNAITESTSIMVGVNAELKRSMEEVAMSIPSAKAPAELGRAYFYLASAGMDAAQSMAALPAVTAFATAGAFDMAQATDLLTDAQTALGLSSKEPQENLRNLIYLSDQLVKANTQANASVQQFSESLVNDAAAAASLFGMELETTLAVLSAYASRGIKGAEAGSLFGRATRLLADAHRENGEVFEQFGIRVIDEATGEYRNFIDIIQDLEDALRGLTGPQRGVALELLGFETLTQKAIVPLLGMSSAMKEWEQAQREASGFTRDVATKQLQSLQNQMKLTWNEATKLRIEFGEAMSPAVEIALDAFRGFITTARAIPSEMKLVIAAVGGLVAIIGPASVALSSVISVLQLMNSVLPITTKLVVGLSKAFAGFAIAGVALGVLEYVSGLKQLNDETERAIDLNEQLEEARDKAFQKRMQDSGDLNGQQRETFLTEEIERASKELEGLEAQRVGIAKRMGELDADKPNLITDAGGFIANRRELEALQAEYDATQARIKEESQRIASLESEKQRVIEGHEKEINALEQLEAQQKKANEAKKDAEVEESIQRQIEALEREVALHGMSAEQAKIRTLELEGASKAQADEARVLLDIISFLDEIQAQQEAAKALAEEQQRDAEAIIARHKTPEHRFEESKKKLDELRAKDLISQDIYLKELAALDGQFSNRRVEVAGSFSGRVLSAQIDNMGSVESESKKQTQLLAEIKTAIEEQEKNKGNKVVAASTQQGIKLN